MTSARVATFGGATVPVASAARQGCLIATSWIDKVVADAN